jgi:sec-independent protein translocase protein TatC
MEKKLTLIEHLNELRKRIIIVLISLALTTLISFPFSSFMLKLLKQPAMPFIDKLVFLSPQEAFMVHMRIAFLGGFILSMPVIIYQIMAFVFPALKVQAKKFIIFAVGFCFLSFILGCSFSYFVLAPTALNFLLSFGSDNLTPLISAGRYISFISALILSCGLIFQMPFISFILTKIGIISHQLLRRNYKYAIVAIFIAAAVITPTADVFNMLILALPMLILYEISIWVSYIIKVK